MAQWIEFFMILIMIVEAVLIRNTELMFWKKDFVRGKFEFYVINSWL